MAFYNLKGNSFWSSLLCHNFVTDNKLFLYINMFRERVKNTKKKPLKCAKCVFIYVGAGDLLFQFHFTWETNGDQKLSLPLYYMEIPLQFNFLNFE